MTAVETPDKDFSAELIKIDSLQGKTISDYFGLATDILNARKQGYKPVVNIKWSD